MTWIDNRKIYDIITQSWIINGLEIYKIYEEVIKFAEKSGKWNLQQEKKVLQR